MLKKTVNYTDYNGVEQQDTYYFNFNKVELVELGLSGNDLAKQIQEVSNIEDNYELFKLIRDIVLKSYGEKSEDGKRFVKSEALRRNFEQSEAYSELLFALCSNSDDLAAFINGIVPQNIDQSTTKSVPN